MKGRRVRYLFTEQADLVELDGFIRSNRSFAKCVRDDTPFPGMNPFVDRAGKILLVLAWLADQRSRN